jgi:RPA family protein
MAEENSEEKTVFKRYPFQLAKVSDLSKETKNVAIIGIVLSKDSEIQSFIIDDSTGKVNVITNNSAAFETIEEGKVVRVLGKTWGEGEDIEIQSDLIQDFSKIDFNLYKKTIDSTKLWIICTYSNFIGSICRKSF